MTTSYVQDEIALLRAELASLRQEVAQLKTTQFAKVAHQVVEPSTTRRRMLKKLAVVAAGATLAVTAGATQSKTASAVFLSGGDQFWGAKVAPNGQTELPTPAGGLYGLLASTNTGAPSPLNETGTTGPGAAVFGSSTGGYGSELYGGRAPLFLRPAAGAGAPTTGTHRAGELFVSNEGSNTSNVYFCKTGNGTGVGTWVKLNRTVNGTDGDVTIPTNINFLATTVRVAATNGTTAPLNNAKLTATGANPTTGDSGTVQLTFTGAATGIPVGAKGVVGVLTNVGATAGGNLRFWTSGVAPLAVNLNIPGAMPSLNLSASFAIPLDAAGKAYLGFGSAVGAQSGYVVDVSGYWL